jgi:hypothetical protein
MATVVAANLTGPSQPEDPFRYGWRSVRRVRPNGVPEYEQVPLTLEDILHPQEGDFSTHSQDHGRRNYYLLGYVQGPSGYQVLAPNERGWLWLVPVRVWLGIADNEIVFYNEAGQPLGDYRALTATLNAEIAARIAAEKRATEEAEARAAAEAQLRVLEAELRRLRGDVS